MQANLIGIDRRRPGSWSPNGATACSAQGVWANEPVPLYPYPSSPDYRALWGEPDDQAWERAHEHYLAQLRRFSDIQEAAPAAAAGTGGARCRASMSAAEARADDRSMRSGGVWRYRVELARRLAAARHRVRAGGARAGAERAQQREVPRFASRLIWTERPLDWMAEAAAALDAAGRWSLALAPRWDADILHLNLPSQAAMHAGGCPVVVASHSCVATWWHAVSGGALPPTWHGVADADRDAGWQRADAVMAPRSHGAACASTTAIGRLLCIVPTADADEVPTRARRAARLHRRTLVGRGQERAAWMQRPHRRAGRSAWPARSTARMAQRIAQRTLRLNCRPMTPAGLA